MHMTPLEPISAKKVLQDPILAGERRKKVLVFSPDVALAKSLSLLLEDRFEIACETQLENLKATIGAASPALLLVDLFAFPSDILKEVNVLRTSRLKVPVVLLRVYRQLSPEIEETIRDIADFVFYKPFDVNAVADAVHKLLDGQ
jgi:DNA-binding NtrC family response regulator